MKDSELLAMLDMHKQGTINIKHCPHSYLLEDEKVFPASITLKDLFRMFELAHERNGDAVTQD